MARPARSSAEDIIPMDPAQKAHLLRRLKSLSARLSLSHDHLVLQSDLIERKRGSRAGLSRKTIQRMRQLDEHDLDQLAAGVKVNGAPDTLSISRLARLVDAIEQNMGGGRLADWYRPISTAMDLDLAQQQQALRQFTGTYKCYQLQDSLHALVTCITISRGDDGEPRFRHLVRRNDSGEPGSERLETRAEGRVFFTGSQMVLLSMGRNFMHQLAFQCDTAGPRMVCRGMMFGARLPQHPVAAIRMALERVSEDPLQAVPVSELGEADSQQLSYDRALTLLRLRREPGSQRHALAE